MSWTLPSFALTQPFQWNALLVFGSLLLLGLVGGHLVTKVRWVPRITVTRACDAPKLGVPE